MRSECEKGNDEEEKAILVKGRNHTLSEMQKTATGIRA